MTGNHDAPGQEVRRSQNEDEDEDELVFLSFENLIGVLILFVAIEKVWSVAKAYFNKRMIARPMQELSRQ